MNIYLTANGLDTRFKDALNSYNQIIKLLKDKKVAIIPNAKLKSQDRTNSYIVKEELNKHNIESKVIDIDEETLNINDYSALYLSGGEPKYLMDSIYNSNLYNDIKGFIDNDGIVIGQSAGAMIMNKDYYDTSTGELLVLHNGLNYSTKMIVPHYDNLKENIKSKITNNIIKVNDTDLLIKL